MYFRLQFLDLREHIYIINIILFLTYSFTYSGEDDNVDAEPTPESSVEKTTAAEQINVSCTLHHFVTPDRTK